MLQAVREVDHELARVLVVDPLISSLHERKDGLEVAGWSGRWKVDLRHG